jgi:hypothetical protein
LWDWKYEREKSIGVAALGGLVVFFAKQEKLFSVFSVLLEQIFEK